MTAGLFILAAVLALLFAGALGKRYQKNHAPFYLWWTISFALYTLAYLAESFTVASRWNLPMYQIYIIASAGLVGAMSVGTTYLAFTKKIANVYAVLISLLGIALIISTIAVPPVLKGSWLALNGGKGGIVGATQIIYIVMASVGGTIVIVGALWSWWKTRRYYNLLIAAGALTAGLGGTMASQGVALGILPVMNIVGLVLIFLGYVYSRSAAQGRVSYPKMAKGA
jgi:cytochrome c oxidase subunit IV